MNLNEMTSKELGKFWAKHRHGNKASQKEFGLSRNDVCTLAAYAIARSCVLRLEAEANAKWNKEISKRCNTYHEHCYIYRGMMSPKAQEMVK